VDIRVIDKYPGLETTPGAAIAHAALAASDSAAAGKVGFGTEGGLFREMLGLETVVCGPGSIDRAHKADEFVTRAELAACDAFLDRVVERLY
jgi:acetylornithine deacetylase